MVPVDENAVLAMCNPPGNSIVAHNVSCIAYEMDQGQLGQLNFLATRLPSNRQNFYLLLP